jgi:hypothetical protein
MAECRCKSGLGRSFTGFETFCFFFRRVFSLRKAAVSRLAQSFALSDFDPWGGLFPVEGYMCWGRSIEDQMKISSIVSIESGMYLLKVDYLYSNCTKLKGVVVHFSHEILYWLFGRRECCPMDPVNKSTSLGSLQADMHFSHQFFGRRECCPMDPVNKSTSLDSLQADMHFSHRFFGRRECCPMGPCEQIHFPWFFATNICLFP